MGCMSPCFLGAINLRQAGSKQQLALSATQSTEPSAGRLLEEVQQLRAENGELRSKNQRLEAALSGTSKDPGAESNGSVEPQPCSESHLRAILANPRTTLEQLKQAVLVTEALLGEAHRELSQRKLRAKRAAFEQLHLAIEAAEEGQLDGALAAARAAEVDDDDLSQGEAKLAELRSATDEERAARAARELELARRKRAFLLVRKDDAGALRALLDELEPAAQWQDWRDHAGRTLARFARDLRAAQAQEVLAARQADGAPSELKAREESERPPSPRARGAPAAAVRLAPSPDAQAPPASAVEAPAAPDVAAHPDRQGPSPAGAPPERGREPVPPAAACEEEQLKARALRAVVQDDCATLQEVLQLTTCEVMSRWQNKAGKDLLTLSEERGSTYAYSVIAKALGMMKEMKRDSFEERESVWVFAQGDVQPRRATVLEDTPEDVDQVLLEYWDGDAPPERVERCLVRRMWA